MLTFLNTKARPFVVFLASLVALGCLVLFTLLGVAAFTEWYGLIAGILCMLLAIPCHLLAKKHEVGYLIAFLLNSVGSGFSVSAYYACSGIRSNGAAMLVGALAASGVLFLVYLMLQSFGKTKKVTVTVAVVLNILLLIAAAVLWIVIGGALYSFGFFSLLVSLFYLGVFGVTVNHEERSLLRDISFGSFGSLIILTVVVAVVLSEGDLADGLDLDLGGDGSKKKQKNQIKRGA